MGQRQAELFKSLRPEVLGRLLESRASIDQGFAAIPEDVIRPQLDTVLDKMQSFLATEDIDSYRGFASRWIAMRIGEGTPENLIHTLVAIGDVVAQSAQRRLGPGPEYDDFARAVARMSFLGARLLVELLAEELDRRAPVAQRGGRR
jgi:hypothetical protein